MNTENKKTYTLNPNNKPAVNYYDGMVIKFKPSNTSTAPSISINEKLIRISHLLNKNER